MFKLFRHAGQPTDSDADPALSSEITITADGQLSVMGMDVQLTGTAIEAQLETHLQALRVVRDQLAARLSSLQPDQPDYEAASEKLGRLQRSIASTENDKASKAYARGLLNIAEAYDAAAIIDSAVGADGSVAWDKAWDVLDKQALKVIIAISRSQQDLLASDYVELLFARGMHYLRRMSHTEDKDERNRSAQAATTLFYTYLLVVYKLGLSHWQLHDAVRNIHIAVDYAAVSEDQLRAITTKVSARSMVQAPGNAMNQAAKAVQAYAPTDADHKNLETLIH